jgi:hypothetical protein
MNNPYFKNQYKKELVWKNILRFLAISFLYLFFKLLKLLTLKIK